MSEILRGHGPAVLPDCMMPDGGNGACLAYRELHDALSAAEQRWNDALDICGKGPNVIVARSLMRETINRIAAAEAKVAELEKHHDEIRELCATEGVHHPAVIAVRLKEARTRLADAALFDWIPFNRPSSLTVRTLFFWPSQITGDTYSQDPDLFTADPLLMYIVPAPLREDIDAALALQTERKPDDQNGGAK